MIDQEHGQPIITPDPHGKGWFIFINTHHYDDGGNHRMSSRILGNQNGYRNYHEAAEALVAMQDAKSL